MVTGQNIALPWGLQPISLHAMVTIITGPTFMRKRLGSFIEDFPLNDYPAGSNKNFFCAQIFRIIYPCIVLFEYRLPTCFIQKHQMAPQLSRSTYRRRPPRRSETTVTLRVKLLVRKTPLIMSALPWPPSPQTWGSTSKETATLCRTICETCGTVSTTWRICTISRSRYLTWHSTFNLAIYYWFSYDNFFIRHSDCLNPLGDLPENGSWSLLFANRWKHTT